MNLKSRPVKIPGGIFSIVVLDTKNKQEILIMLTEYGTLYVLAGSTAQTLSTSYEKMTGWATRGDSSYYVDGLQGIRADLTQDRFSLLAGKYLVCVSVSGKSDTPDVELTAALHVDAAAHADGVCVQESEAADKADINFVIQTIVDISSPKALDLRIKGETGTPAFTPTNAHFTVIKLS